MAIHKIIVHKANGDCIISINELCVVLSILLAIEAEALVTLRHSLPILLLVLNVLIFLLTSARDVPLGGAHSAGKKRLPCLLSRACEEGLPILLLVLVMKPLFSRRYVTFLTAAKPFLFVGAINASNTGMTEA